ncbi:hypothetical protein NM688_g7420 [Phlebia brevispora]|uniref:Uncharacterized protein n=1 Tax=Phlebia brevispora TaxID=194682 RepID=A0ACC1S5J6_9APHY|nr:hypothetical protein NM688_g7420 [Phlebia brevispora]
MISISVGPYEACPRLGEVDGGCLDDLVRRDGLALLVDLVRDVLRGGPPFDTLYLIPKSALGPPGLWLAVRRIPPYALYLRITFDAAGVERIPLCPMMNLATPLAEPILRIVCTVSGEKKRPSPPMTRVCPLASTESKMA